MAFTLEQALSEIHEICGIKTPNLVQVAYNVMDGKHIPDGIIKSTMTDKDDPTYWNFIEIRDGRIVGVGEEYHYSGGWIWHE